LHPAADSREHTLKLNGEENAMETGHNPSAEDCQDRPGHRREDWLVDGLLCGFAAAFVLMSATFAAYWFARIAGDQTGNQFERWLYYLQNNSLTKSTQDSVMIAIGLNLIVGIGWAMLYGYSGAPNLSGPGYWRGMVFALVPFLLSVFVFFPIMCAGVLGKDLGAGPLPVIGNLILHLIYGATLGSLYSVDLERWLDGSHADLAFNRKAEQFAAVGLVVGAPIGLLLAWRAAPSLSDVAGSAVIGLVGTLIGASLGMMIGSFAGLEHAGKHWQEEVPVMRTR